MRTIIFTIQGEQPLPSTMLAGQAGEHLDTRLSFSLPDEWRGMDEYYLHFFTETGRCYKTRLLHEPVQFSLPQALLAGGNLALLLEGRRGKEIHRTSIAKLLVEECPDILCGETETGDPFEGLVKECSSIDAKPASDRIGR